MKLRNAAVAGLVSVSAVAGLVSPAYAAARPAAAGATCSTSFLPE
jgi:ammonia channel protein AmtB